MFSPKFAILAITLVALTAGNKSSAAPIVALNNPGPLCYGLGSCNGLPVSHGPALPPATPLNHVLGNSGNAKKTAKSSGRRRRELMPRIANVGCLGLPGTCSGFSGRQDIKGMPPPPSRESLRGRANGSKKPKIGNKKPKTIKTPKVQAMGQILPEDQPRPAKTCDARVDRSCTHIDPHFRTARG